jgi:peroxiredoxin/tetratricopeptide (TPR) repeat protein
MRTPKTSPGYPGCYIVARPSTTWVREAGSTQTTSLETHVMTRPPQTTLFSMTSQFRSTSLFVIACVKLSVVTAAENPPANNPRLSLDGVRLGHSSHGAAFDAGPRQKPWELKDIGRAPFPITTKNPEVQKWFDQGNALIHSFFYFEAERAFRWCAKLEPENAMAYWGMALATGYRGNQRTTRANEFLREAVRRKGSVSEREKLFIEAWAVWWLPDPLRIVEDTADARRIEDERRRNEHVAKLETLCLKFPDDLEARSYLALAMMGRSRYGAELVIREILEKDPRNPAAHHYRIHNWDYHEPAQALASSAAYGREVPGIGHALHMPGHIYGSLGMWHEAALSMDAATRAEKRYMQESLTFSYDNWNYAHNRNFLCHSQEQLGMAQASIAAARQLVDAPLDPLFNADDPQSTHSQGVRALARAFLRFERWDDFLDERQVPWRDLPHDKMFKTHGQARAWLAKGDLMKAEKAIEAHAALKTAAARIGYPAGSHAVQSADLRGRLALAKGDTLVGLNFLAEAAEKQHAMQKEHSDPPFYPEVVYTALGEVYLTTKSPTLAVAAFQKSLEVSPNDLFALSGLVRAHAAIGEKAKAEDAMARLLFVGQNADRGLRAIEQAKATGIDATPRSNSPVAERVYASVSLEKFGPETWEPYAAPKLEVSDGSGTPVTLEAFREKNVILVFYLGSECAHCMEQLQALAGKKKTWDGLDTVVLAVSSAKVDPNDKVIKGLDGVAVRLLSDTDRVNARRFRSYDDFEEMELHSTTLIDKHGRIYWARFGGDPFTDVAFLEKQLKRMNARLAAKPASE